LEEYSRKICDNSGSSSQIADKGIEKIKHLKAKNNLLISNLEKISKEQNSGENNVNQAE